MLKSNAPKSYAALLIIFLFTGFVVGYVVANPFITVDKMETPERTDRVSPKAAAGTFEFTLETSYDSKAGRFAFLGPGGVQNPSLRVDVGSVVKVTITNSDGIQHDFNVEGLGVASKSVSTKGQTVSVSFRAQKAGEFFYFCSVPGHRQLGMEGKLIVGTPQPGVTTTEPQKGAEIVKRANDIPPPLTRKDPTLVKIVLETREIVGQLAEGVTYEYWTFNGTVPGPLIRVLHQDTIELTIVNKGTQPHSIDLHAATGPGGGSAYTQTPPGESRTFRFKALHAGLFIYHCASPHIPTHVINGLYGMILVEPREGLQKVDREFYVVQGEFYTSGKLGEKGYQKFDLGKARDEKPEYVVFNGKFSALTGDNAMKAKVGETIRVYFGVGGFLPSSFHVIGEIFDRVYLEGAFGSPPLRDIETVTVPAGANVIVEFAVQVPGNYILVDHSLFRAIDKGAVGVLVVEGPENPEIISSR